LTAKLKRLILQARKRRKLFKGKYRSSFSVASLDKETCQKITGNRPILQLSNNYSKKHKEIVFFRFKDMQVAQRLMRQG